jgi:pre-mRNA-splicing factor SYF1
MFLVYLAKASANYGLPATRPIYEKAIEVLPNKQTAQMCMRYAELERKLGEIDRARGIYAHASQYCDPRVEPKFWSEWNNFEIEHGSEDTFRCVSCADCCPALELTRPFREYLRIRRSVQALFNTEASYLAAQTVAARQGEDLSNVSNGPEPADPMAAAERDNMFVRGQADSHLKGDMESDAKGDKGNEDEIQISDEE